MNKYLFLVLVIIFYTACDISKKQYSNQLIQYVTEAEIITYRNDSIVQQCMDNRNYNDILLASKENFLLLNRKFEEIQHMSLPSSEENLKIAALSYIQAMMEIVKAQELYANYNDTIPEIQASLIDDKNEATVENAAIQYRKFNEYKKAYLEKASSR